MPRFFFSLFNYLIKKDDDGGQEQLTQGLWVCGKVLGVSEKDKPPRESSVLKRWMRTAVMYRPGADRGSKTSHTEAAAPD